MHTSCEIREHLTGLQTATIAKLDASGNRGPDEWGPDEPGSATAKQEPVADEQQSPLTAVTTPSLLELLELILKDRPRLERIVHDPSLSAELIPRLLAAALIGFTLFGATLAIIITAVGVQVHLGAVADVLNGTAPRLVEFTHTTCGGVPDWPASVAAAGKLIAAYDFGLIAAAGVCLPSLYFYGLLAGIPLSLVRVTVHTLKGMATTAVALVGVLPVYMAWALGVSVFHLPQEFVDAVLWLGLVLPFLTGLFGVRSLYNGFAALASRLPAGCRGERACLLRRLVVSWSFFYNETATIKIYTLWEYFSRGV